MVDAHETCPRTSPVCTDHTNLARMLRRRPDGMFVAPFEAAAIGPDLFDAACRMGLEGLMSKKRDRRYNAGVSKDWIKVKNPQQGEFSMKYLAIHERGDWSDIKPADTLEEAKRLLIEMVKKPDVREGDVFRLSIGEITSG